MLCIGVMCVPMFGHRELLSLKRLPHFLHESSEKAYGRGGNMGGEGVLWGRAFVHMFFKHSICNSFSRISACARVLFRGVI